MTYSYGALNFFQKKNLNRNGEPIVLAKFLKFVNIVNLWIRRNALLF
jgi:hypothetical protein